MTAAVVGLEMSSYTVVEGGGTVQVCVVSSPELAKAVEIELVTMEDSAGKSRALPKPSRSCFDFLR